MTCCLGEQQTTQRLKRSMQVTCRAVGRWAKSPQARGLKGGALTALGFTPAFITLHAIFAAPFSKHKTRVIGVSRSMATNTADVSTHISIHQTQQQQRKQRSTHPSASQ